MTVHKENAADYEILLHGYMEIVIFGAENR